MYNGGSQVAVSGMETTNKWQASGVTTGNTYDIYVEAYDGAGNMKRKNKVSHEK